MFISIIIELIFILTSSLLQIIMMNSVVISKLKLPRLSSSLVQFCSSSASVSSSTVKDPVSVPVDYMPDKLFKQIDLELRAHEPAVLKSYSWFAGTAAKELNIRVDKSWAPEEPHKERKTLLKAAYVNKKHRVQYEMRFDTLWLIFTSSFMFLGHITTS